MAYTPQIDASGIWTLKAPFDKLVTPKVVYVCRSIRSIGDILGAGETVYDRYYEPLGLSESQFEQDLSADIKIVGLQAGSGEWVYVPASFVLAAPDANGVRYSSIVMGVSLGAIPDELNLDGLITSLSNVVQDTLGIVPDVRGVLVAEPAMISRLDHERLDAVRQAAIKDRESDLAKRLRAEQALADLQLRYNELELFIQRNFTPQA